MMNSLKRLMLFKLLLIVISLKKTDYDTNISEIEKKISNHNIYITTQDFDKLPSDNVIATIIFIIM